MTDEFTKKTRKKFGERGNLFFDEAVKTTNLDDLSELEQETKIAFCTCGTPLLVETVDVYRCVECPELCCRHCRVSLSRYNYCPVCARQRFGVDKRTFLSLVFIDHHLMDPEELIRVAADPAGEVIDIEIDPGAGTLLEHDYLTNDGRLTPTGKEALYVGHQLYDDDADVQGVLERIHLAEVVNGG